jgi:hypothetical protein
MPENTFKTLKTKYCFSYEISGLKYAKVKQACSCNITCLAFCKNLRDFCMISKSSDFYTQLIFCMVFNLISEWSAREISAITDPSFCYNTRMYVIVFDTVLLFSHSQANMRTLRQVK